MCDEVYIYEKYSEPGYSISCGKEGIAVCYDWNEEMEEQYENYEIEWEDQWASCSCCGGLVRLTPDCWNWKPFYWCWEGRITCGECIHDHIEDYVEYLRDNCHAVDVFDIDFEDYGYTLVDHEYESGFYGRTDNPMDVLHHYQEKGFEVIFSGLKNEQFRCCFSVYVKPVGVEEA